MRHSGCGGSLRERGKEDAEIGDVYVALPSSVSQIASPHLSACSAVPGSTERGKGEARLDVSTACRVLVSSCFAEAAGTAREQTAQ